MSKRHTELVTVSGRKSGKPASKKGGKKKVKHILIRPVENGFVSEIHHEPDGDDPYNTNPTETAHAGDNAKEDMLDHVDANMPDPNEAAAQPAGQPAGDGAQEDNGAAE